MSKAYQISDSYGVVLTDSGRVLPYGPSGVQIDPRDSDALLQLALAAAVEISILRSGEESDTLEEIFSSDFSPTGEGSEESDL